MKKYRLELPTKTAEKMQFTPRQEVALSRDFFTRDERLYIKINLPERSDALEYPVLVHNAETDFTSFETSDGMGSLRVLPLIHFVSRLPPLPEHVPPSHSKSHG